MRERLLGFVPVTASTILASLRSNQCDASCVFSGDITNVSPPHVVLRTLSRGCAWARWWLGPLLLIATCWALLLPASRELLLERTPTLWPSEAQRDATTIAQVLPPMPRTLSQSFELGSLEAQLRYVEAPGQNKNMSSNGTTQDIGLLLPHRRFSSTERANSTAAILARAAALTGRQMLSPADLHALLPAIMERQAHRGLWQRLTGALTFVNTIWLFAVIGIVVSIGPSVHHLLRPFELWIKRVARWAYDHVIKPTVKRLHTWGVFEAAAWAFSLLLVIDGNRVWSLNASGDTDAAVMISLTGVLLCVPCQGYSTVLRGCSAEPTTLVHLSWGSACAAFVPCAMLYQSALVGSFAVLSCFCMLGFGVWAHPLCLCIGFNSAASCERVCLSSLVMHFGFMFAKATDAWPPQLEVFSAPLACITNIMLFLSLLIIGSWFYDRRRWAQEGTGGTGGNAFWVAVNCAYVALVVLSLFMGNVLGLQGSANAATTFAVLFAVDKYAEFHCAKDWNSWVLMLFLSLAAWQASLWLMQHPQHLASMLSL